MSMQQEAAAASAAEGAEKMDVDEQTADKGDEDYSEAMNDPAFLQVWIRNLKLGFRVLKAAPWSK